MAVVVTLPHLLVEYYSWQGCTCTNSARLAGVTTSFVTLPPFITPSTVVWNGAASLKFTSHYGHAANTTVEPSVSSTGCVSIHCSAADITWKCVRRATINFRTRVQLILRFEWTHEDLNRSRPTPFSNK